MSQDKKLRPQVGVLHLTGLGVGAVISGDFFGWNFGLDRGGFGGLLLGIIIVGAMYVCVSLTLAELASMYPSAEGAFKFSRIAFGPYGGFICGLAESLEYVLLVPVIITGLGDHLNLLFGIENEYIEIVWWTILLLLYAILNMRTTLLSFKVTFIVTVISTLTLVVHWLTCLWTIREANDYVSPYISDNAVGWSERVLNIPVVGNNNKFLPKGFKGFIAALPFAAWFFIAVEEVPLSGEDAINPTKNIPKSLVFSIIILGLCAFFTLLSSVSVLGGSLNIATVSSPLVDSFLSALQPSCEPYTGDEFNCNIMNNSSAPFSCKFEDNYSCKVDNNHYDSQVILSQLFIQIGTFFGLFTSAQAIIYAGGRQIFSLTRNGTFPQRTKFGELHSTWKTPYLAVLFDIICAYIITIVVMLAGGGVDFLVSLSVFAACVSYVMSMASYTYIKLNKEFIKIDRPYKSPLSYPGAIFAMIISIMIMISFIAFDETGLAGWGVLGAFIIFLILGIEFKINGIARLNKHESDQNNQDTKKDIEMTQT